MAYCSFQYRKTIKFHNIRASTKVWKVQLKIPYGYWLKENNKRFETTNWTIREVLN